MVCFVAKVMQKMLKRESSSKRETNVGCALCVRKVVEGGEDLNLNKVHFSTEKDDISLYGTPKEEIVPLSASR